MTDETSIEMAERPGNTDGGNSDENVVKADLWDEIGFHRPLGGFWFKLVLELATILIPILFVTFWLTVLYPYPESMGYTTAFSGLLVLVFTAFDIGTANTLNRFVADAAIKNPKRMLSYIQYFIWYQSWTGLIQISVLSIWALYFVGNTTMAYGVWIIVLVVSKQYPGYLGVFKSALGSLQQFNKKSAIDFLQGEAFQRLTEIGFVLLGRYLGSLNPAVGELLGIAIGSIFGLYLDDYIAMFVSGYYLAKHLKPWGIKFKDLFKHDFDFGLVKECLSFGLKTGVPGLLTANTQVIGLSLMLAFLPQYTTFVVLSGMAVQLVAITQRLVDQDFSPLYTEAYMNGKKKLCQYYNAHAMRFFAINTGFAMAIMLLVMSVLPSVFEGLNLERYILTIPFIIPAMIYRVSKAYFGYPEGIMIATNKASAWMVLKIINEAMRITCLLLTVMVFRVQDLGFNGMVYVIALVDYPAHFITAMIAYTFVDRKIFKIRLMTWQTFVAPAASCGVLYTIFIVLKTLFLDLAMDWNLIIALVIGIVILVFLVFALYFPLTVLFGGWDENSIRDFKKIVKMAGPSKLLVTPMANLIFKTVPHARLHNRFKYDEAEAFAELKELVSLRQKKREEVAAKKS